MGVFDELHGCITTLDVFTRLRYLPAREISLDDLDEALARLVDPASTTGVRIMAEGVARFEVQRLRDHLAKAGDPCPAGPSCWLPDVDHGAG